MLKNRVEFTKGSKHSGELFINNHQLSPDELQQYMSYMPQENIKNDFYSVKEILLAAAELRYNESEEVREEKVTQMLKDMQLVKCADTYFGGDEHKGLSRGKKKRICIAAKLLLDSPILLLDEPTSGLDSSTSFKIMHLIKEYAVKNNKIILLTIHQPSSQVFSLINKLILINHGKTIFQDTTEKLADYFEGVGYSLNLKYNVADSFMMKIEKLNHDEGQKNYLVEQYVTIRGKEILQEIEEHRESKNIIPSTFDTYASFQTAFKVLITEQVRSIIRNPKIIRMRFIGILIRIFLVG